MSRLKVSIAMATYNGADYLVEQLKSLAEQTFQPDELVATDDGSTDLTLDILRDFAKSAPFAVRVIENESNLGYNANFEKAASLCTGDVVFFCDQDDVWLPNKIDSVVQEFRRSNDIMVVMNDAQITDAKLNSKGFTQFESIRSAGLTLEYFNTGCCSAHRKDWQRLVFPIPANVPYFDMWINLFAKDCGLASFLPYTLQFYRRHGENTSDYVLSESKGSVLRLAFSKGIWNVTKGWKQRISMLEEERTRLENAANAGWLESARENVLGLLGSWERRMNASLTSRFLRPILVLQMLARGDYRSFSGWKSALKDLIRP